MVAAQREGVARLIGAFIEDAASPAASIDRAGVGEVYGRYVLCRACLRAMGLLDASDGRACGASVAWLTELAACAAAH